MRRTQRAERRWDVGDRLGVGPESICPEALPGLLALPDADDPEPLVGRARGMQQKPFRGRTLESLGERRGTAPSWRRRPRRSRTTCAEPRARRCRSGIARAFRRSAARSHWSRARHGSACARPGRGRRRRRPGRAARRSSGDSSRRCVIADGEACTVDELVDALWGEAPPPSGRKLVQVYVSQLRKALPASIAIGTRVGATRSTCPRSCSTQSASSACVRGRHGARSDGNHRARRIARSTRRVGALAGPAVRRAGVRRVRARRGRAAGGATARRARRARRTLSSRSAGTRRYSASSWAACARQPAPRAHAGAGDAGALPMRAARPRRSTATRSSGARLDDELGLEPGLGRCASSSSGSCGRIPTSTRRRDGSDRGPARSEPANRLVGRTRELEAAPRDPAPQRRRACSS